MNENQLFLIKCEQLQKCVTNQSDSDILTLSLLLRQFLLEGFYDRVNRTSRFKIKFVVGSSTEERAREMKELELPTPKLHFLRDFPSAEPRNELDREEFIRFKIVYFDGNHYTVQQLIKTCANVLGGVHLDSPDRDDMTKSGIRQLGVMLQAFGLGDSFSTLVLIGSVTHNAMGELIDDVKKRPPIS